MIDVYVILSAQCELHNCHSVSYVSFSAIEYRRKMRRRHLASLFGSGTWLLRFEPFEKPYVLDAGLPPVRNGLLRRLKM